MDKRQSGPAGAGNPQGGDIHLQERAVLCPPAVFPLWWISLVKGVSSERWRERGKGDSTRGKTEGGNGIDPRAERDRLPRHDQRQSRLAIAARIGWNASASRRAASGGGSDTNRVEIVRSRSLNASGD